METVRTLERLERKLLWHAERRRAFWLEFHERERKRLRKWKRFGLGPPHVRPLPEYAAGAICCGATPEGPCTRTDLNEFNGRCPRHGGMSTGPVTSAGRAKVAANLLQPSERHRRMIDEMAAREKAKDRKA